MHIFKINILHLNQKLKFLEMGITDYDYASYSLRQNSLTKI